MKFMERMRLRARTRTVEHWLEARRYCTVQHDFDIADGPGASVRGDLNDSLEALVTWNSGASDPPTTFARMRVVQTTAGVVKRRDAANATWIVESTDDETRVLSRSSNTMLDVSDISKAVLATGTWSQTLDAAATLGDGWWCDYRNDGVGTITLDPNGAETINGAATLALALGDSCRIVCNGAAFKTVGLTNATATALPRSYLAGCGITNGTDATNDINIAVGVARDSTNTVSITVASMAGKQLDAGWAPGAAAGMRNSGIAIANTTYHIYAVAKADGTQDIYAHTSVTVATVITALQAESGGSAYLYARRIASIYRAAGALALITQLNRTFLLKTPIADVTNTADHTTAATGTLASVPTGVQFDAIVSGAISSNNGDGTYVSALDQTDIAVTGAICQWLGISAGTYFGGGGMQHIRTNTSAQIRYKAASATVDTTIYTHGWIDEGN